MFWIQEWGTVGRERELFRDGICRSTVASTRSRRGPTSDRSPPPTVKIIFVMPPLLIAALHEMCDRNTAKYYLSDSQLKGSFKHKCLCPLRHFDGFKLPVRKIQ